jgi:GTP cyclohydrolase II
LSVQYVDSSKLPTQFGEFLIHGFQDPQTLKEHVVLTFGELNTNEAVLARVHSECLTGDALFSARCDCGPQLQEAMRRIAEHGSGMIMYLRQEGRGIGLMNKIRAYHLQDDGADTVEANEALGFGADQREYSMCVDMLAHFGVSKLKLMTNNPRKLDAMAKYGIHVEGREEIKVGHNVHNEGYIATKGKKLGHMFSDDS